MRSEVVLGAIELVSSGFFLVQINGKPFNMFKTGLYTGKQGASGGIALDVERVKNTGKGCRGILAFLA